MVLAFSLVLVSVSGLTLRFIGYDVTINDFGFLGDYLRSGLSSKYQPTSARVTIGNNEIRKR